MSEPSERDDPPLPAPLAVLGVVICCLVAVGSAVIEVFYVPFYVGRYVFPITVVAAVVLNIALPRMVRTMIGRGLVIALPAICWVLTVIILGFTNTSRGSVIVPGYGQGQYVGVALFFAGVGAAFAGVVREVVAADREEAAAAAAPIRSGSARR